MLDSSNAEAGGSRLAPRPDDQPPRASVTAFVCLQPPVRKADMSEQQLRRLRLYRHRVGATCGVCASRMGAFPWWRSEPSRSESLRFASDFELVRRHSAPCAHVVPDRPYPEANFVPLWRKQVSSNAPCERRCRVPWLAAFRNSAVGRLYERLRNRRNLFVREHVACCAAVAGISGGMRARVRAGHDVYFRRSAAYCYRLHTRRPICSRTSACSHRSCAHQDQVQSRAICDCMTRSHHVGPTLRVGVGKPFDCNRPDRVPVIRNRFT